MNVVNEYEFVYIYIYEIYVYMYICTNVSSKYPCNFGTVNIVIEVRNILLRQ